jgi:hypothetical protein
MTNGEKLARLVVRLVLALPPRPPAPDEHETPEERERRKGKERRELLEWVRARVSRFATGDWIALLEEARRAWPAQRPARGQELGEDDADAEARHAERANRAIDAARDGRVARARQVLCSSGMLPGTEATRLAVERLLRPVGREPPGRHWIERGRAHALGIEHNLLAKRVREMGKGGAPDMCGWYAEHYQLLLADKRDFAILHTFLDDIARCRMSESFYDSACGTREEGPKK